jgi:hypothetical protein
MVVDCAMNSRDSSQGTSLPSLIAWLSVCLISAAWSNLIDLQWQRLWMEWGSFGSVAAVGLDKRRKAEIQPLANESEQTTAARVEDRLSVIDEQRHIINATNRAFKQIETFARSQQQPVEGLPLAVIPLAYDAEVLDLNSLPFIDGSLRRISTGIVDFDCARALEARIAVLRFNLGESKQLCFVIEDIVRHKNDEGFSASGTVVAVGVPDCIA